MKRLLALLVSMMVLAGCGTLITEREDNGLIDAALESTDSSSDEEVDPIEVTPVSEGPEELPNLDELDGEI